MNIRTRSKSILDKKSHDRIRGVVDNSICECYAHSGPL